ncbi:NAD(P)H-dependent flavin oxidoreductase [Candidatus Nitrotoga sp. M5]|uniref:NAD(P)H-dependent flavin oxidoreductase n=1 Tax=Candidatus Nitrotoga sp. M5 TaxID=2890409 RepID=UPI001EF1EF6D|nr:nitronate monooxygenase [Candidatus Nitrotoga sp. M5]CAH1385491.1 Nitronate monooxygenase [Candidatus Nitrotoga sp. M5]
MNLQQLLRIQLPIIQAPMAGVAGSELAIAVCNAGGLGSLPCATLSLDVLRQELQLIRKHTTCPFNVNFFCHAEPEPNSSREEAWRATVSPYFDEYGIINDVASISTPGRLSISWEAVEVLAEFEPPVVSFHFGLPPADMLAKVRSWGAKILSSATTVEEALWLQAKGVDAIIAQGLEAGGHRGMFLSDDLNAQAGTFALVPQIVRAVKVPVIAAGGIADANGVAAALVLGAAGVQIGTAYLLCPEAKTSNLHRAALKSDAANVTAVTNLFSGRPARAIVNRLMRELGPCNVIAPAFPLAATAIAPLRRKAESQGSTDFSPLWAGQNVSGCKEVPAAMLTKSFVHSLNEA